MRNIKNIKIIITTLCVVVVGAGIIFYACKKEYNSQNVKEKIKMHKSSSHYNGELIQSLMEDFIVEQLTNVINSFDIEQQNGILAFQTEEDVNAIYDTLIYFSNMFDNAMLTDVNYVKYTKTDSFPDFPILYAFEVILGFNSLRATIEEQMLALEENEGISDECDPDNHFIVSDYLRTILSPDCELIIGSWIYLYGEIQNLLIPDLNFEKLTTVKYLWHTHGELMGTFYAFQDNLAVYNSHKSTNSCDTSCCNIDYIKEYLHYNTDCPRTYSFIFDISCPYIGCITNCLWNFGDGTTSTLYGPTHTYANSGQYLVTFTVRTLHGDSCSVSKYINVTDCKTTISTTTFEKNPSVSELTGYYQSKSSHCDNLAPVSYLWHFTSNGSNSTEEKPEHIYNMDGTYYVYLTVTFSDGCIARDTIKEIVRGTGNTCVYFSGDKNKKIPLSSGYRLKHCFSAYNVFPFFRIVVKSVHKKQKENGNWKRAKAYYLWVTFDGIIRIPLLFQDNCMHSISVSPLGLTNYNKKVINYDYGVGEIFKVGHEELFSQYKVKTTSSSSQYSNYNALKLHDRN